MVTFNVAFAPGEIRGVPLPAHVSAAALVDGLLHSLKVCGIAPLFVTLNVTEPCGTVFVDSLKPNSEGLPAVTLTVAATRLGWAWAAAARTSPSEATASSRMRACL